MPVTVEWWVYVLQSQQPRFGKNGDRLPGLFYVGCSTDVRRRLREHNGELKGKGGKYTSSHRPWLPVALYGPYSGRGDACKAEYALKHGKRSVARTRWSVEDSPWCRGLGAEDPWVTDINVDDVISKAAPSKPARRYKRRYR